MGLLQGVANFAQIFGVLWLVFFGSKSIFDVIRGIKAGKSFVAALKGIWSSSTFNNRLLLVANIILTVVVLILSINLSTLHSITEKEVRTVFVVPSPTVILEKTVVSTVTQGSSQGSTSSPTATPAPPTKTYNISLTRVAYAYNPPIDATLNTIELYNGNLIWTFTFTNKGSQSFLGGIDQYNTSLSDLNGNNYSITPNNDLSLAPGQSVPDSFTMNGDPPHGTTFILHLFLDGQNGGSEIYANESISW